MFVFIGIHRNAYFIDIYLSAIYCLATEKNALPTRQMDFVNNWKCMPDDSVSLQLDRQQIKF